MFGTNSAVIDNFPSVFLGQKLFPEVLKFGQSVQSTDFVPGLGRKPRRWVGVRVIQANTTRQEESPFVFVDFIERF